MMGINRPSNQFTISLKQTCPNRFQNQSLHELRCKSDKIQLLDKMQAHLQWVY